MSSLIWRWYTMPCNSGCGSVTFTVAISPTEVDKP